MRVHYQPNSAAQWAKQYQQGSGFDGQSYQRGGGLGNIFRGIMRVVFPLLKSAGKAVGKEALRAGAHIASDIVAGDDPVNSIQRHTKQSIANQLNRGVSRLQKGKGLGKRPRKSIKGTAIPLKRAKKTKRTKDILG